VSRFLGKRWNVENGYDINRPLLAHKRLGEAMLSFVRERLKSGAIFTMRLNGDPIAYCRINSFESP
jgi:hypothetical protein